MPTSGSKPKTVGEDPQDIEGRVLPSSGKNIKLVEIFKSVKGEGTQAGIPMLFVRFSKCNLACAWCDTPYNRVAIEMPEDQLVNLIIETHRPAWVIFTGGEPTLQLTRTVTQRLKEAGIKMAIETNGMIWTEALRDLDYINISPKLGHPIHDNWTGPKSPGVNEMRYTICDGQQDIWNAVTGKLVDSDAFERIYELHDLIGVPVDYITISPAMKDLAPSANFVSGQGFNSINGEVDQKSLNRCLYLVDKYRFHKARLSVQVHKFIGAR